MEKPRFAVWGGRMNLQKAGGTAVRAVLQASSQQRHAHRPAVAILLVYCWLKRAPDPSRAKQGTQTLNRS